MLKEMAKTLAPKNMIRSSSMDSIYQEDSQDRGERWSLRAKVASKSRPFELPFLENLLLSGSRLLGSPSPVRNAVVENVPKSAPVKPILKAPSMRNRVDASAMSKSVGSVVNDHVPPHDPYLDIDLPEQSGLVKEYQMRCLNSLDTEVDIWVRPVVGLP